jgi:octaprenyl-diphosphate synthase
MPFCLLILITGGILLLQENKRKSKLPAFVSRVQSPIGSSVDPFRCVASELDLVEQNLIRSIRSEEQMLTEISAHLIQGGGKRIRPMVSLIVFKGCGGTRVTEIVDIATALELIHTATLLHDDIIDGAEIRRGKESAFKRFGLKATLVSGDFLFIKAFEFAGKFDNTVVQWTADACTSLTEGEMLQGFFNRNRNATPKDYLEIVKKKTASLFETGAKVGAYLAGASPAFVDAVGHYALNLGIAFQIIDDVLDVVGERQLLGKPIGMDLRDGNPSIPIILALRNGDQVVLEAFQNPANREDEIERALQSLIHGPAISEALALAKNYAERALKTIAKFPPSIYHDALKTLVHLITDRES